MLKLKLQHFGHLMWRADTLEKTLMLGKIEGRGRRGVTEDEMVGWYHRLNGHEFEQTPGDGEGQGSLECCSPWGCKELDTTEWLNNKCQHGRRICCHCLHGLLHILAISPLPWESFVLQLYLWLQGVWLALGYFYIPGKMEAAVATVPLAWHLPLPTWHTF